MNYVQVRGFALPPPRNPQDIGGWIGWCLAWVRTGFGIGARYPTAIAAWHAAQRKHADRNFPAGVDTPVFWEWGKEGHVAIRRADGSIWSSPFKKGRHYQIFGSIDELSRAIGAKYLGWSEDLCGQTVLKPLIHEQKPDTKPEEIIIIEEEIEMAQGAFYRIGSGQGAGAIFHQSEPGSPLFPLQFREWRGFEANGNKYVDLDAQDIQELQRVYGVFERDTRGNGDGKATGNGRRIADAADPTGFKVWMPGWPAA